MVADSVNAAVLMTESFYMQDMSRFDKFTVKAYNRYLFVPQHAPLQHCNGNCDYVKFDRNSINPGGIQKCGRFLGTLRPPG